MMEKESEMSTNTNEYMYQYKGAALQQSGQTGVPGHGDQQRGGAQRDGTDPQHYISMNENELGANQQNLLGEREESATVSTAEEPAGVPNPLNALDITVQSPRDSAAVNEDYEIMTPPISPSLANKLSRERINEVQQPPVYLSLVTTTQTNSLLQSNASSVPPVIAHSSRTQRPVLSQVTQPVPQTGPTTSYLTPANNQGVASPRLNTVQSLSAQSQATRSNQPKDYLYPLQSYSICGQPVFVPQTAVAAHQIPIASQPPGRAAPITSVTAQPGIRQPANQIQDLSRPTNRLMTTAQPHAGTSHPAPVVRLQEGTVQLNNGRDRQVNGTTQQVSIIIDAPAKFEYVTDSQRLLTKVLLIVCGLLFFPSLMCSILAYCFTRASTESYNSGNLQLARQHALCARYLNFTTVVVSLLCLLTIACTTFIWGLV